MVTDQNDRIDQLLRNMPSKLDQYGVFIDAGLILKGGHAENPAGMQQEAARRSKRLLPIDRMIINL